MDSLAGGSSDESPDQPWKFAMFNTRYSALGAAFALAVASPVALADEMPAAIDPAADTIPDPMIETTAITPSELPAGVRSLDTTMLISGTTDWATFRSLFSPVSTTPGTPGAAISGVSRFARTGIDTTIVSQVYKKNDEDLYAYTFQLQGESQNPRNMPTIRGIGNYFNAQPVANDDLFGGSHVVKIGGPIEDSDSPFYKTPTIDNLADASFSFERFGSSEDDASFAVLTSNFRLPEAGTLNTPVVALFSTVAPEETATVDVNGPEFYRGVEGRDLPEIWNPQAHNIQPPIPEPATLLGWAGVLGAAALVRMHRRRRAA